MNKSTAAKPMRRYIRPAQQSKLTPQEKSQLLIEHINHYAEAFRRNPAALVAKVPRNAFDEVLDQVGHLLLTEAFRLANMDGPVREFLEENPLPETMRKRLPPEFRTFCLAINALKQWVSAEQAATDRYLLGGTARAKCKALAKTCIVTGEVLDPREVELHHPVRDGRPPIPLSKVGHAKIENQTVRLARRCSQDDAVATVEPGNRLPGAIVDSIKDALKTLKDEGHFSWVMLRRGCLDCLGRHANHSTRNVGASSRTFARKAIKATGLTAEQLLEWLDRSSL
jgi:hypothetical protein